MIFKCKNCGGNIVYNPEKGKMCCPHCESIDSEDKLPNTGDMMICANCGAPLEGTVKEHTSAFKCPNCSTYTILEPRVEGEFKPDLILPFSVSKQKAIDNMKKEFANRIFTPKEFLNRATVSTMEGTYVPFFMYDYDTSTHYEGTGTKVRHWTSGDYEYTETSYYNIVRDMDAGFDRVPVDASDYMDDQYMDLMEPYEYEALENFQEKYMSGFMGEKYNQPEGELAPRAIDKVHAAVESLINASISGYATVTKKSMNCDAKKKDVKYALLPVWEYIFRYKGEDYKFHVNGQTGKVVGKTPVAKDKVVLFGVTVFGLLSLAGAMIRLLIAAFM